MDRMTTIPATILAATSLTGFGKLKILRSRSGIRSPNSCVFTGRSSSDPHITRDHTTVGLLPRGKAVARRQFQQGIRPGRRQWIGNSITRHCFAVGMCGRSSPRDRERLTTCNGKLEGVGGNLGLGRQVRRRPVRATGDPRSPRRRWPRGPFRRARRTAG